MVKKINLQDVNGDNRIKEFYKIWLIGENQIHKWMILILDPFFNLYNYYKEMVQYKSYIIFWEIRISLINGALINKLKSIIKSVKLIIIL